MELHERVLQVLLIGITNGAIVALIALGYTLVYGIIELINFAHGDVFMVGGFIALIAFLALVAIGVTAVPVARPSSLRAWNVASVISCS